jgi:hypothetical protein
MIATDHRSLLLARNKTKRQYKDYMYEAMRNMLTGFAGHSASENVFAVVAAFLEKTGHDMAFLKDADRLIIKEIRRAIAGLK